MSNILTAAITYAFGAPFRLLRACLRNNEDKEALDALTAWLNTATGLRLALGTSVVLLVLGATFGAVVHTLWPRISWFAATASAWLAFLAFGCSGVLIWVKAPTLKRRLLRRMLLAAALGTVGVAAGVATQVLAADPASRPAATISLALLLFACVMADLRFLCLSWWKRHHTLAMYAAAIGGTLALGIALLQNPAASTKMVAFLMRDGGSILLFTAAFVVLVVGWYAFVLYLRLDRIAVSQRRLQEEAAHYRVETELAQAQAREQRLAAQLAESKLQVMQAQIEPHFLFNTLGAAQQLARHKAPEAAALIGNLITFLRSALPTLREGGTCLRGEAKLVEAYLAIMQTRLGGRLRYRVDLPLELQPAHLPPALLITLVENAIKHGIEPAMDGGEITVTARADDGRLRVTVADTGLGLTDHPKQDSGGVGLANVRERLRALFGDQAELSLEAGEPRGFVASIVLPLQAAEIGESR